jgi:hypothetical protein
MKGTTFYNFNTSFKLTILELRKKFWTNEVRPSKCLCHLSKWTVMGQVFKKLMLCPDLTLYFWAIQSIKKTSIGPSKIILRYTKTLTSFVFTSMIFCKITIAIHVHWFWTDFSNFIFWIPLLFVIQLSIFTYLYIAVS